MNNILVTGALGQIGSELTETLCDHFSPDNVIITDKRPLPKDDNTNCRFCQLDITDVQKLDLIIKKYNINVIYHLAALLSAVAEKNPKAAWKVNIIGLYKILEAARTNHCSVFIPSSIGAFGPSTPKKKTPQETIQRPNTMYGVTKVAGELLCDYYYKKFGVDTRGIRYPGIISSKTLPGGGTTDYAVEIYYAAVKTKQYTCFLHPNTHLDMIYMPDAVWAAIALMEADPNKLGHRNAYNITAMSVCPQDISKSIQKIIPEFKIDYQVDPERQSIADSWPDSIDDSTARKEWGWNPQYDLEKTSAEMINKLSQKLLSK